MTEQGGRACRVLAQAAGGLLAAGLLSWLAQAAQAAPAADVPTHWVAASREPIPLPYPSAHQLPRTLSIDALTEAEIQEIRRSLYAELKDVPPRRVEGVDGCMAWLYKRHAPSEPWQAFGFAVGGTRGFAAAKINGGLRRSSFNYSISPQSYLSLMLVGRNRPGTQPGRGYAASSMFAAGSGYQALKQAEPAYRDLFDRQVFKKEDPEARQLLFGFSDAVTVADKKMRCTHLKARCRRYVAPVTQPARWHPYHAEDGAEQTIAAGPPMEIAIEDMCPHARDSMVEGLLNSRSGGAEPDMRKHGIKNNSSLLEALQPYATQR